MVCKPLSITDTEISEDLSHNGVVMIKISIKYPRVSGATPHGSRRINKYYRFTAEAYLRYIQRTLLPQAIKDWTYKTENGYPFFPFDAMMTYQVTYNDKTCLSLFWEIYEYTGGAHGITIRHGDTWQPCSGWPVDLKSFFPKGTRYRRLLTDNAIKIASQQINDGTGYYFEGYPKLIRQYFRRNNFYITPEGIAIFYGLYTIAPYASGIPVFVYEPSELLEQSI